MVKQYKKITSLLLTSMLFINSISSSITYAFDFPNIFSGNEYKVETKDIKNKYNGKKLDKIKKSVKGKNYYTILIESNDSLDKTNDFFIKGDKRTKLKKVGNNKYLVKIPVNSEKLGNDLGKIDSGILPTKIGNYSVIEPEIVNIQTEGEGNNYLSGEELDKLWYTKKVGSDTFQEELKTKQKIKVGVLDTGIDYNHNDLKDNYDTQLSYNFISDSNDSMDDNGHGTQVTGVLGASVNGVGIFGVDSNTDLVSLKVLDKDGLGTTYDILDAILYAKDNGIKVLNMSFGGSGNPQTSSICQAITDAKANGIVTVVPAGNANTSIDNTIPAACTDAITVGSTDKENKKADFSSFGDGVDVYAPGVDIYTTNINNSYISQNGTSLSTPIVTGLVARELAVDSSIVYEQIVNNLLSKYSLVKNSDIGENTGNTDNTIDNNTGGGITKKASPLLLSLLNKIEKNKKKSNKGNYKSNLEDNKDYKKRTSNITTFSAMSSSTYTNLHKITDGLSVRGTDWNCDARECDFIYPLNNIKPTNFYYYDGNKYIDITKIGYYIDNKINVYGSEVYDGVYILAIIYNSPITEYLMLKNLYYSTAPLCSSGICGNNTPIDTCTSTPKYEMPPILVDSYNGNLSVGINTNKSIISNTTNGFSSKESVNADKKASKNQTSNEGDPVTLSNGEFTYSNTLMSVPGSKLPFQFDLTYRNQTVYNGPVGNKFDFNYNMFLEEKEDNSVNFYNGKLGLFNFATSGTSYTYSSGLKANLVKENNLYKIVFDNGDKYYFGTNLKISKIEDKFGNNLQFTYNDSRQLTKVTDSLNRNYIFSYYDSTRLSKVTDFNGRYTELVYYNGEAGGSVGDLKSATIVNGESNKTISFEYDANSNIYKMYDSKGQLYVTNIYNSDNRVTSQTYGNGTITYAYTLATDGTVSTNTVTNRSGVTTVYTYDSFGNTLKREIKDKDGVGSTIYEYQYDSNHRLSKEILPRGNGIYYSYDSRGNIIEKREMVDAGISSTNDLVTTYEYNQIYDIPTKVTLPNGLIKNYTLDANGNITKEETSDISSNDGVSYKVATTYEYNILGQLVKKTDSEGNITKYEYTNGQLTKQTKLANQDGTISIGDIVTTFSYDSYGNILTSTDGAGKVTTFTYNDFNQLVTTTTPTGIITKYYYDENNNKIKEEKLLPDNKVVTTLFEYDSLDHLVKQTQDIDENTTRITTMTYDNDENLLTTQEGNGAIIKNIYSEIGKVKEKRIITDVNNPDSDIVTSYTYDRNGNVISETDAKGNTTTYDYDMHDRVIKKTYPNSTYETFVYNKLGKVIEHTNNSSTTTIVAKTTYIYDELGNVLQTINHKLEDESQIITKAKYNKNGQVTVTSDPAGNLSYITYDSFSRPTESTDSLGNKTVSVYDKNSQVLSKSIISGIMDSETSSGGRTLTTTYTYDNDGRLLTEANTDNKTKTYTYNNLNQVTSITDEKGNITYYTYNLLGNVTQEKKVLINSDNTITDILTTYSYDSHGNVVSLTDSNGNVTRYRYDKIGRKTAEIYPDNTQYNFIYDRNSNLVSTTDANGTVVTNTYDNLSRISERNIQTGNGVIGVTKENYSYDTLGRLYGSAQELNGTGGLTNVLQFNYNSLSELTKETNNGVDVNYTYDINGNRTNIVIDGVSSGSGYVVSYAYDSLNRLYSVNYNGKNISSYSYTGVLLDKIVNGNNTETNRSYDSLFRLKTLETSKINNDVIKSYNYTYDDVSNITNDGTKSYTYDSLYRLIDSNYTEPTKFNGIKDNEVYNYDKMGNRITTSDSVNGTQSYSGNILNQYVSKTASGTINYTYDNNGNLKQDDKQSYSYDYKNRLVEVRNKTNNSIIAQYNYDTLGRRIQKTTNTESVSYLYSGEQLIKEVATNLESNTIKTKSYVNGNGIDEVLAYEYDDATLPDNLQGEFNFCTNRVLNYTGEFLQYGYSGVVDRCNELNNQSLVTSKKIYYIHTNNLGSTTDITNESGSVVLSYEYDNFGNAYIKTGSGSYTALDNYMGNTHGNTRLYTGREYDKEIGLYYYRARYYSADLGKFISRDPVGTNDQINLYTYVGNNPVMYSDPSGMTGKSLIPEDYTDYTSGIDISSRNNSIGNNIRDFGIAYAAANTPACVSSISITGGCAVLASVTGPGEIVCTVPAISAGASCGQVGIGVGIAGVGTFVEAVSNGGGGNKSSGGSGGGSLKIGEFKVNKDLFHREIKPNILNDAGKKLFEKMVGKNPDIVIEKGNIILKGNGEYAGKSFKTDLKGEWYFNN